MMFEYLKAEKDLTKAEKINISEWKKNFSCMEFAVIKKIDDNFAYKLCAHSSDPSSYERWCAELEEDFPGKDYEILQGEKELLEAASGKIPGTIEVSSLTRWQRRLRDGNAYIVLPFGEKNYVVAGGNAEKMKTILSERLFGTECFILESRKNRE